ncbi:MAG TPA: GxxExxY protein [Armatimonadota bacterium]|nr:GxxExxY protein [Armatimonadota bacterium]
MNEEERAILDDLAHKVIGAAYEVANQLGAGFLEKVYERSLLREMTLRGIPVETQVPLTVFYKGERVGEYVADMVIARKLLVELKCVDHIAGEHLAQCLNYLKATKCHLALLINYQHPKIEWKRVVLDF